MIFANLLKYLVTFAQIYLFIDFKTVKKILTYKLWKELVMKVANVMPITASQDYGSNRPKSVAFGFNTSKETLGVISDVAHRTMVGDKIMHLVGKAVKSKEIKRLLPGFNLNAVSDGEIIYLEFTRMRKSPLFNRLKHLPPETERHVPGVIRAIALSKQAMHPDKTGVVRVSLGDLVREMKLSSVKTAFRSIIKDNGIS